MKSRGSTACYAKKILIANELSTLLCVKSRHNSLGKSKKLRTSKFSFSRIMTIQISEVNGETILLVMFTLLAKTNNVPFNKFLNCVVVVVVVSVDVEKQTNQ